jgi:hypothetical protein
MVVGEQHASVRHYVFRMVYTHGLLVGHHCRYQLTVRWRSRVGINDRKEVFTLQIDVAGPSKQVMA